MKRCATVLAAALVLAAIPAPCQEKKDPDGDKFRRMAQEAAEYHAKLQRTSHVERVVARVGNRKQVYINLAARHGVKKGTRFAVFTRGKRGKRRDKGWIVVQNVTRDFSVAAITSELDAFDPIQANDLLDNPLFRRRDKSVEVFLLGKMSDKRANEEVQGLIRATGATVVDKVGVDTDIIVEGKLESPSAIPFQHRPDYERGRLYNIRFISPSYLAEFLPQEEPGKGADQEKKLRDAVTAKESEIKRLQKHFEQLRGDLAKLRHGEEGARWRGAAANARIAAGTLANILEMLPDERIEHIEIVKEIGGALRMLRATWPRAPVPLVQHMIGRKVDAASDAFIGLLMVDRRSSAARVMALNALGKLSPFSSSALPTVKKFLQSPEPAVRKAAEKAQQRIKAGWDYGIKATIQTVNEDLKFVTLSVGRDDKVRKGMQFVVLSAGRAFALVQVDSVWPKACSASFICVARGYQIQPGAEAVAYPE